MNGALLRFAMCMVLLWGLAIVGAFAESGDARSSLPEVAQAQGGERVLGPGRPDAPMLVEGEGLMPKYMRASFTGDSVVLENDHVKLAIFKRIGGWGWGEIYTPDGKLMAVLDHLGEVMLRDQDIPMRLETTEYAREEGPFGERLIFQVASVVAQDKLNGSSFEEWMRYPFEQPVLVGEVTLTLAPDEALITMTCRYRSTGDFYARYIRGPWLRVGQDSFGTAKDDAIFPGVEWVIDEEWSSGTDFFKDPWAERVVPHPNKVAIPMMTLSHEGTAITLSWDPKQDATRWFNYRAHRPQPVFASPNFVDRLNNTLMGLMVPDASVEGHENQVYAESPLLLHLDQRVDFDAEIRLSEGNSLQGVVDWVNAHGMPEAELRWPFREALDRIAEAYNTNLWHEGQGFGIPQRNQISPRPPQFLTRYLEEYGGTPLAEELAEKVTWCYEQIGQPSNDGPDLEALERQGQSLLEIQQENGAFLFEPDGRHYRKDDFVIARAFIEPMGLAHDTALDITMLPATQLLDIGEQTGNQAYLDAAKKSLEFCMPMTRPEAGDFWETPLHAPNLLAAGHAAIAYYRGYELLGDERYRDKAIYWIRSVLPFTHLWEPDDISMIYNTKPCLTSSDWYFANWVRDHVQWEVLAVFASSADRGIHWNEIDPEVDWRRYHEGITAAAVRWISDHTRNDWRPHNLPETLEEYKNGAFDGCYPDTHNSTTGMYGGMMILPDPIARNIMAVLDYE